MKEIIYLSIHIREKVESKRTVLPCVVKNKTIRIDRESNFGGKSTNIKMDALMKCDSMVRPDMYTVIHGYVWCSVENVEKAKELLIDYVNTQIHKRDMAAHHMMEQWKNTPLNF